MKVALVTGGSRGLGKSMSLHLAKKGYNIIIAYKSSKKKADEVVDEIRLLGQDAIALKFDAENINLLDSFVLELKNSINDKWGYNNIDLLVNNAGIGLNSKIEDITVEQFDELFNIHVKSAFFLTQKLLPTINDGGKIINISSGLTRFSLQGHGAYAMMKGAVEIMTKYLALELSNRKISVNTIAPGAIETDFGGGVVRDNIEVNKFLASVTALGRVGQADDIGAALANIVSSECNWLNGQRVELSGGMYL